MGTERARPTVRGLAQARMRVLGPGVTASELLTDEDGCRGLHQRRLRFASRAALDGTALDRTALDGTALDGAAGGRGEAWYVISGAGALDLDGFKAVPLGSGTAVWMKPGLRFRCQAAAGPDLEVLSVLVQAEPEGDEAGPELCVATLDACEPERTGDREFRVLLSEGLTITQFAGLIPPGRAPAHHHTYDEVVHVLAGRGTVHLSGRTAEIGPGTSIYLPPYQPHCLENTGSDPLEVLGVFHPAGSPAAKQAS